MFAPLSLVASRGESEGARVQPVVHRPGRQLGRLRVGLEAASVTAPGKAILWQNDRPQPSRLGPEGPLADAPWTWVRSDSGVVGFGRAHNRLAERALAHGQFLRLLNQDALRSVIVGPVSATVRSLNTEVNLAEADGAREASAVNLDSLHLVSRSRLVRREGRATPTTLRAICAAAAEAIGCSGP